MAVLGTPSVSLRWRRVTPGPRCVSPRAPVRVSPRHSRIQPDLLERHHLPSDLVPGLVHDAVGALPDLLHLLEVLHGGGGQPRRGAARDPPGGAGERRPGRPRAAAPGWGVSPGAGAGRRGRWSSGWGEGRGRARAAGGTIAAAASPPRARAHTMMSRRPRPASLPAFRRPRPPPRRPIGRARRDVTGGRGRSLKATRGGFRANGRGRGGVGGAPSAGPAGVAPGPAGSWDPPLPPLPPPVPRGKGDRGLGGSRGEACPGSGDAGWGVPVRASHWVPCERVGTPGVWHTPPCMGWGSPLCVRNRGSPSCAPHSLPSGSPPPLPAHGTELVSLGSPERRWAWGAAPPPRPPP